MARNASGKRRSPFGWLIHSYIHSFIQFVHSFFHSQNVYSHTHQNKHSFIHSFSFIHRNVNMLVSAFITNVIASRQALRLPMFYVCLIDHWQTSFIHTHSHSYIHSFVHVSSMGVPTYRRMCAWLRRVDYLSLSLSLSHTHTPDQVLVQFSANACTTAAHTTSKIAPHSHCIHTARTSQ